MFSSSTSSTTQEPEDTTHPDIAGRAKQWEVASGLCRKAFRSGRFLSGFNTLRRTPGSTPSFRFLTVLANAGEMVYFFLDHFLWLSRIGVLDAKLARKMSFISAFDLVWFGDQMAEGGAQSRYVKLTKDQAPLEDIKPGELNQPIDVPQLNVHRCNECGQPLPESFEPPADEPWTTGIFGCAEDTESCWTGLFCPCVLFGRNVEKLREDTPWTSPCICHAIFVEGGIAVAAAVAAFHGIDLRTSISYLQVLPDNDSDPCLVHCCMHWCALCQEHREMKGRLSDNVVMPMTIVNPPPVQEMNSSSNTEDSAPSSANGVEHSNLEMQAL
ncbi:hypothetical protein F0562_031385 [Nyssa sinensis]|uniref:Cell number regulator 6 n=1 Tax=Nyssa sinensis TaxID=561372 RepID=A0A5J5AU30_9ASTE|nr:hypothetical protein F0562_031385 [Nyssa sinensis]